MISAATQTLADFIASGTAPIAKEQISFSHPRVPQKKIPALNLYCYRVQASEWTCSHSPSFLKAPAHAGAALSSAECPSPTSDQRENSQRNSSSGCQWFELTFLISVSSHTTLAEQCVLSEILAMCSSYRFLPEEFLSPLLRGQGQLPMKVSTEAVPDNLLFWQVLRTPLRLALHVTITVPFSQHLGFCEQLRS